MTSGVYRAGSRPLEAFRLQPYAPAALAASSLGAFRSVAASTPRRARTRPPEAARSAGLSRDQRVTAIRVARHLWPVGAHTGRTAQRGKQTPTLRKRIRRAMAS